MDKRKNILDGNIEQQTDILKEFLDIKPEQNFQDIEVGEEEDN